METILVVEDERKLNGMISDYLEAVGYQPVPVTDGLEALRVFKSKEPDFVILDIMLPGIDGLDVLRRIREISQVPVILLTARAEEGDKLMGLELGADDYVTKPFSLKELVARIRAVDRRTRGAAAASGRGTLEFADLLMDLEKRKVTRGGTEVPLTSVQFEILAAFLRNPGRVFTRMDLLKTFQQDAYEGYERTIDVHIKNIRKVLEPEPSHPRYIETVWRVGYKLSESAEAP